MKKLFSFLFVLSLALYSAPALAAPTPNAPSNLAATAISSSQINLTWTDNATNETGFKIERATGSPTTFVEIATVGVNATSYSNTNGAPNTTYYYRVRAYNAKGNSAYSNTANATTFNVIPAAPTNLTAQSTSTSIISLRWTDNSNNETAFYIYRSTDGTNFTFLASTSAGWWIYTNYGLQSGTTYYYKVLAHNAVGDSAFSNTASATTMPDLPAAPTSLNSTFVATGTGMIYLSWTDNASNETGFEIERSVDSQDNFTAIATQPANYAWYLDGDVSAGTTYYYRVRAYNNDGYSNYSNTVSRSF